MSTHFEIIDGRTSSNRRAFFIQRVTTYTAAEHPTLRESVQRRKRGFTTRDRAEQFIAEGRAW